MPDIKVAEARVTVLTHPQLENVPKLDPKRKNKKRTASVAETSVAEARPEIALFFLSIFEIHKTKTPCKLKADHSRLKTQTKALLTFGLIAIVVASGALLLTGSSRTCACSQVVIVTLYSATLYGGPTASPTSQLSTASFTVSLNNPGQSTYISSLTVQQEPFSASPPTGGTIVTTWDKNRSFSAAIDFTTDSLANNLPYGKISMFIYYPRTATANNITAGQAYYFLINFATGQSLSGAIIAQ